jgi:hypothetical protein
VVHAIAVTPADLTTTASDLTKDLDLVVLSQVKRVAPLLVAIIVLSAVAIAYVSVSAGTIVTSLTSERFFLN